MDCKNQKKWEILFSAFYQPARYLAVKELSHTDTLTGAVLQRKVEQYGDMTYFSFKIENNVHGGDLLKSNINNPEEYYGRLEYLSFKKCRKILS